MKFVALLAAGAATAVTAAPHWSKLDESYSFEAWLAEHKDASPVEPTKEAFTANLARILAHNKEESTWKAGVNKVSRHSLQYAPVGTLARSGGVGAARGAEGSSAARRERERTRHPREKGGRRPLLRRARAPLRGRGARPLRAGGLGRCCLHALEGRTWRETRPATRQRAMTSRECSASSPPLPFWRDPPLSPSPSHPLPAPPPPLYPRP
jgi:hypothetical protein